MTQDCLFRAKLCSAGPIAMTRVLLLLVFYGFLTGSPVNGASLPPCPEETSEEASEGTPESAKTIWNDCIGTIEYSNGDKYTGAFKEGKRSGDGQYVYSNGNKYRGPWADGRKNGKGEFIYSNGSKYIGEFVDGKLTGTGTLINYLGDKYVGGIKNGKRHGSGVITSANGYTFEGVFSNDVIISGKGRITKSAKRSKEHAKICPGARNNRCPRPPKKAATRFLGAERSRFRFQKTKK